MQTRSFASIFAIAALGAAAAATNGCSGSSGGAQPGDDAGDDGAGSGSSGGCFGCSTGDDGGGSSGQPGVTCSAGSGKACIAACGTTTITGQVFDPAGQNPLYNVQVYIPNGTPQPLPKGPSCDCASLYTTDVIASAVTDADGQFTIMNAPSGTNIPLTLQVGKWRMQYKLPQVTACAANNAGSLLGTTLRLPKNHTEGDIPDIAISTGAADSLECLPLRMGIDASEYVSGDSSSGRIHIYMGGSGTTEGASTSTETLQASTNLWDSVQDLSKNDVVLFSCEGAPTAYLEGSDGRQNLFNYVTSGGRVFASHYHWAWFVPPDSSVPNNPANPFAMLTPPLATWENLTSTGYVDSSMSDSPYPTDIATTLPNGTTAFPEGVALKSWLGNVSALDASGKLEIYYARHNADLSSTNAYSQPWVNLNASTTTGTAAGTTPAEYFSFDLPYAMSGSEGTGSQGACGRVVYSDLHVSGGPGAQQAGVAADYPSGPPDFVPDGCATRALTPQEKALEFMLFDLSSCLVPTGQMSTSIPPAQ